MLAIEQRKLVLQVDPQADPNLVDRMARTIILFAFIKCTICNKFGHSNGYCPINGMMYQTNRNSLDKSLSNSWLVWKSIIGDIRKVENKREIEDRKKETKRKFEIANAGVPRDPSV